MSKESKRRPWRSQAKRKGRLAEQIAAWLHAGPGVRVETNVRLPTIQGNRRREIDVLLTVVAAGYPVRLAIECKNRGRVGAPDIDGFVGKLQDVGIPPQLGVFVSVGGYTSGAEGRAKDAGLRTLLLEGLTPDGLATQVKEAVESTIYLVASVGRITIESDLAEADHPWHLMIFVDEDGAICGNVPYLIWTKWISDGTPSTIGKHEVELTVPPGWRQVVDGDEVATRRILVELGVFGLVLSLEGKASPVALRPPGSPLFEKMGVKLQFDRPEAAQPLKRLDSEDELEEYLKRGAMTISYRIKVPRIILYASYFPPTQAAIRRYFGIVKGEGRQPDFTEVEGAFIESAFAPFDVDPIGG